MVEPQTLIRACVLLAAGLCFDGCAAAEPERRAPTVREQQATAQAIAEAEAQRERCANIEVFPVGQAPPRPFRVIGPVSADWSFSTEARQRTLRSEACALGADAVVSAREFPHRRADGESWTSATGSAVVYTER